MIVSLFVAMDRNRVIGCENAMPWHLPADLQYFKHTTMGKPIIMGRKTHESIGRPLPGRINIVVTRNPDYQATGCTVVASLEQALQQAGAVEEVMITGGATLYEQALPLAQRIYLTEIDAEVQGDTFFPELSCADWQEVSRQPHSVDERHVYDYSFVVLERQKL